MARVVVHDVGAGMVEDVVILVREIARGSGWNHGLNLTNRDLLNGRIAGEGAGGHSRAEADAQHGQGPRMQQGGQVSDHALELHVVEFGGGLHVAVYVDVDGAVVPSRNGYGRVDSFGGVQDLRRSGVDAHAAPIRDEFAGDGIDVPG